MITVTGEVQLTPDQLAEEFWNMDEQEQADFFNLNRFEWSNGRGQMQLDWFISCLDDDGRRFVERMYSSLQGWYDEQKERQQDRYEHLQ